MKLAFLILSTFLFCSSALASQNKPKKSSHVRRSNPNMARITDSLTLQQLMDKHWTEHGKFPDRVSLQKNKGHAFVINKGILTEDWNENDTSTILIPDKFKAIKFYNGSYHFVEVLYINKIPHYQMTKIITENGIIADKKQVSSGFKKTSYEAFYSLYPKSDSEKSVNSSLLFAVKQPKMQAYLKEQFSALKNVPKTEEVSTSASEEAEVTEEVTEEEASTSPFKLLKLDLEAKEDLTAKNGH